MGRAVANRMRPPESDPKNTINIDIQGIDSVGKPLYGRAIVNIWQYSMNRGNVFRVNSTLYGDATMIGMVAGAGTILYSIGGTTGDSVTVGFEGIDNYERKITAVQVIPASSGRPADGRVSMFVTVPGVQGGRVVTNDPIFRTKAPSAPRVVGLPIQDAMSVISSLGYSSQTISTSTTDADMVGIVYAQQPSPGSSMSAAIPITLWYYESRLGGRAVSNDPQYASSQDGLSCIAADGTRGVIVNGRCISTGERDINGIPSSRDFRAPGAARVLQTSTYTPMGSPQYASSQDGLSCIAADGTRGVIINGRCISTGERDINGIPASRDFRGVGGA